MEDSEREAPRDEELDINTGEGVVVARYGTGAETGGGEEGESAAREESARTMLTAVAEGANVDVLGLAGVARGEQTNIQGIAGVVTGNRTKLTGYAEIAAARDEVEIEKGAAAVVLAGRKVELEDHGYAALVVAPKVEVQDGGRVLITALTAILGGLAIGSGFGLVVIVGIWLLRRSGFFLQRPGEKSFTSRAEAQLTRRVRGALRGALQG